MYVKANAKVNRKSQIWHYHVRLGNDEEIGSAVMNLCMREKTRFRVKFLVTSIYLSRISSVLQVTFLERFEHIPAKNYVFSQPLVPFRGLDDTR